MSPSSLTVCLPSCHAWQVVPSFPRLPLPPASWIPFPLDSCDSSPLLHPNLYSPGLFLSAHKHAAQISHVFQAILLLPLKNFKLLPCLFASFYITKLLASSCFSPIILSVLFFGSCFSFITNCSCQAHHQSVLPSLWSLLSLFFLLCVYLNSPTQEELMQCIIA